MSYEFAIILNIYLTRRGGRYINTTLIYNRTKLPFILKVCAFLRAGSLFNFHSLKCVLDEAYFSRPTTRDPSILNPCFYNPAFCKSAIGRRFPRSHIQNVRDGNIIFGVGVRERFTRAKVDIR